MTGMPYKKEIPFGEGALRYACRFKRKTLNFLAYHKKDLYRTLNLPKPGGGVRTIHEPCPALKKVQRKLLRAVLDKVILHRAAHGFHGGRSILTNARPHENKEMVVCLDIRDFFPSVTFQRVYGVFRMLGFPKTDSGLLARLTTWQGALPQGAPTSPSLANIVCRKMDRRINGLAASAGAEYSRYADDITLSGPASILKILPTVRRIVSEEGFELAREKTRIMRRGSRQKVCGVVVNEGARLPRETRRRYRAAFHRASLPESGRKGPAAPPSVLQGYRSLLKMFGDPAAGG